MGSQGIRDMAFFGREIRDLPKNVTGYGILKTCGSGITSKICAGYGKWCTLMSGYEIDLLCGIEMGGKSIEIFKNGLNTFYFSLFLNNLLYIL